MNIFLGFWRGTSRKRKVENRGRGRNDGARTLRRRERQEGNEAERVWAPSHLREAREEEGKMDEDINVRVCKGFTRERGFKLVGPYFLCEARD